MKSIAIKTVDNVGDLCNLLRPKNVLALTAVTVEVLSNNGSGPKAVTLSSPTLYIDTQQRAVLIQRGQYFGSDTTILCYSLILYDPTGSRVYQEDWFRNSAGILESSRNFADPKIVAGLHHKSNQIFAWRDWPLRLFTNGKLSELYANGWLPEWLALGKLPTELADRLNNSEHQR